MRANKKIAFGYSIVLLAAAALNYIPGLTDEAGLAFGIFELDPFDDALHVVSAIWAFTAAWIGGRATKVFLMLFGALYLGDGVFGFFTGFGYLDFGILTNPSAGIEFSLFRLLANLPHIALGGFAVWAGLKLDRG